jgi:hypothetical protein
MQETTGEKSNMFVPPSFPCYGLFSLVPIQVAIMMCVYMLLGSQGPCRSYGRAQSRLSHTDDDAQKAVSFDVISIDCLLLMYHCIQRTLASI